MKLRHIPLVHLFVSKPILQCGLMLDVGPFIFFGYLQMGAPIEIGSQGQRADLGSHHLNLPRSRWRPPNKTHNWISECSDPISRIRFKGPTVKRLGSRAICAKPLHALLWTFPFSLSGELTATLWTSPISPFISPDSCPRYQRVGNSSTIWSAPLLSWPRRLTVEEPGRSLSDRYLGPLLHHTKEWGDMYMVREECCAFAW